MPIVPCVSSSSIFSLFGFGASVFNLHTLRYWHYSISTRLSFFLVLLFLVHYFEDATSWVTGGFPAPTPVQNIRVTQNASTGMVYVSWEEPEDVGDALIGYEFTYQPVRLGDCNDDYNGPIKRLPFQPTVTSFEVALSSLMSWTTYRIQIYAQNLVGKSEAATTEFTTPESGTLCQSKIKSTVSGSQLPFIICFDIRKKVYAR